MSTINTVTDRVDGSVLTGAIYNTDHGVHETNANTLNTDKTEIQGVFNTGHGATGLHTADVLLQDLGLTTTDNVTFGTVIATTDLSRFHSVNANFARSVFHSIQSTQDASIFAHASVDSISATQDSSRFHSVLLQEQTTTPDTGTDQYLLFTRPVPSGGSAERTELFFRSESNASPFRVTSGDGLYVTTGLRVDGVTPTTPDTKTLYSDLIPKASLRWAYVGGAPSIIKAANIVAVADTGVGIITATFGTPFTTGDYSLGGYAIRSNVGGASISVQTPDAGSVIFHIADDAGILTDFDGAMSIIGIN